MKKFELDLSGIEWSTRQVWLDVLWHVQKITGQNVHRQKVLKLADVIYRDYFEPAIIGMTGHSVCRIDEVTASAAIVSALVLNDPIIKFNLLEVE